MNYRWARHRVLDSAGVDKTGYSAISLIAVALAAAEETLQGSPLVSAWLKLFSAQLSQDDAYWLRWRGDFAESAELRRAYSGLYGRFFARTLLTQHLGLSRFLSLKRSGLNIPGSISVVRKASGDIPDWIAWDERNARFVLCEAKGSLSSTDFHAANGPKCVLSGKDQFGRVETFDGSTKIYPAEWVAATRWATDERLVTPTTILWDPPTDHLAFEPADVLRHREAITRAWLNSIAPGLGWRSADDLLSKERQRESILIVAKPGPPPPERQWPVPDEPSFSASVDVEFKPSVLQTSEAGLGIRQSIDGNRYDRLLETNLYSDTSLLEARAHEESPHEGVYLMSLITRFGIRPVRSREDVEAMRRAQESAQRLEEPAMLVGIPSGFDPTSPKSRGDWIDDAGIGSKNDLAIFDLRMVAAEPIERGLLA